MADRIKLHKETIAVQVNTLAQHAEQLEWENKKLKKELEELKKKKSNSINNATHLSKTLSIVIGLFRSIDLFNTMEESIIKPLEGLKEFILTHKVEINNFIDTNPSLFIMSDE